MNHIHRLRGKRNKAKGVVGECIAARALEKIGLKCIRPIHTGWTIQRNKSGKIVGAFPKEKVAGDYTAVAPDGYAVLVEVKKRDEDRLKYSDLEAHQHKALYDYTQAGGVSLLVWVHDNIPYVLQYPIEGFKPRSSIKIENAKDRCLLVELYEREKRSKIMPQHTLFEMAKEMHRDE